MSRVLRKPERKPLIALVDRANRALQADMLQEAHRRGHTQLKQAHNAVFATLREGGTRTVDMAARAGMTRQSRGEVVREMVDLGLLEMVPDPDDRRAKLVHYTAAGLAVAKDGYGHIVALEQRFTDELGEDFEATRRVLERVVAVLNAESAQVAP